MRHLLKIAGWATAMVLAAALAPATASAQCKGCEGTRCLLGCPVGDPTNCGYNCIDWRSPDGGSGCISETGGCNLGLLDGAGSIVVPTLRSAERDLARSLFHFASRGGGGGHTPAPDPVAGEDEVLVRPCDRAVVHRSYTPRVADEKRAVTDLVVL
jgi:hypothetical protein